MSGGAAPSGARSTSHGDAVYFRLRDELLDETIPPGTRLLEVEIAERLKVSRTPVREALRRLQSDGFVQRIGPGRIVATPAGPDDLGDIGLLRVEIDGLAARLAASRATARDWGQLRALVAAIGAAGDDPGRLADAHTEFHRALYEVGFGPRMSLFVENHVLPYLKLALNTGPGRAGAANSLKSHESLLRAISSGDVARAVDAARDHAEAGVRVARSGRVPRTG